MGTDLGFKLMHGEKVFIMSFASGFAYTIFGSQIWRKSKLVIIYQRHKFRILSRVIIANHVTNEIKNIVICNSLIQSELLYLSLLICFG